MLHGWDEKVQNRLLSHYVHRPTGDWSTSKSIAQWSRNGREMIKNLSKGDQKSVKVSPETSKEAGHATIMKGKHDPGPNGQAGRKEEGETYGAITEDHRVAGR
jgi:hypothetical protein